MPGSAYDMAVLSRSHVVLAVAVATTVAMALVCIVPNWRRWSATINEPNHVATGLEWWEHGRFHLWTETPPLVRAAVALGPWLAGATLGSREHVEKMQPFDSYSAGLDILHRSGAYERNLAQARAGVLPFFFIAVAFVGLLACRARTTATAAIAVILAATWPPLVAHATLATTDVGFAAVFLGAVWAMGVCWIQRHRFNVARSQGLWRASPCWRSC